MVGSRHTSSQRKKYASRSQKQKNGLSPFLGGQERGMMIFLMAGLIFLGIAAVGLLISINTVPTVAETSAPAQISEEEPDIFGKEPLPLELLQPYVNLAVGEEATLSISGGEGSISWFSTNHEIVTVENGKIMGISSGTATITALCGGSSATCEVTVQDYPLPEEVELRLNYQDFTLPAGAPPVQLEIWRSDTNEKYEGSVSWTSSNEEVASINAQGIVTRVGKGTATVTGVAAERTLECIVRIP